MPTQLVFIYNSLRTDLLQISGYNLFAGLLQLARFYASKITFRHLFDVILGFHIATIPVAALLIGLEQKESVELLIRGDIK